MISQLPGSKLITLDHFHHGRDNILSFLKQTLTLGTDLPSIHAMLLPRLPSMDLWNEYLIHHQGILQHSIDSDQITHFTANKVMQWAHDRGITGITMFPTILKQLV